MDSALSLLVPSGILCGTGLKNRLYHFLLILETVVSSAVGSQETLQVRTRCGCVVLEPAKGQQENACNLGTRTRQTLCGWDESHHTKLRLSWINLSTTDVTDTEFALSTHADLVQAQSLVS